MGLLKWDDSPHFKKPQLIVAEPDEPVALIEPELPVLTSPHTVKEITEAILDDNRYNAINPNNQQHIIDMALASARKSGMLIEDTDIKEGSDG